MILSLENMSFSISLNSVRTSLFGNLAARRQPVVAQLTWLQPQCQNIVFGRKGFHVVLEYPHVDKCLFPGYQVGCSLLQSIHAGGRGSQWELYLLPFFIAVIMQEYGLYMD